MTLKSQAIRKRTNKTKGYEMRKEKNESQGKKPVYAKKSFGQNFLVDSNYISKIISALDPQPNETIIEIGAGRGALTEMLVESGANIIAIEIDKDLIPVLTDKFKDADNFALIQRDALKLNFTKLTPENSKLKLVANLPYYISTAILQKLIEQREAFSEMILMFQRETVERITAEPENKERGFLTVLVEAYLETKKLFDVPPNAFRPVPKVWSSVARLITKKDAAEKIKDEGAFKQIISAAFKQKRKTLYNNLKNHDETFCDTKEKNNLAEALQSLEINPNRRAETLTLEEWIKLANYYASQINE